MSVDWLRMAADMRINELRRGLNMCIHKIISKRALKEIVNREEMKERERFG